MPHHMASLPLTDTVVAIEFLNELFITIDINVVKAFYAVSACIKSLIYM
jgi:hypothetical protein